jgi:hypothetical protein
MKGPNEFWLNVHRLADSLHAEGLTSEERSQNIVAQFEMLAPIARRELLIDLSYLSLHLADLRVILTSRANALEQPASAAADRA